MGVTQGRSVVKRYMARAFEQIKSELGQLYAPSRAIVQQQVDAIPAAIDADVSAAEGKMKTAFDDITNAARRRGMGFSGIPLGEQADYTADVFTPAVLKARAEGSQRRLTLQEALLGMDRDVSREARGIYDNELARDFQEREFQESIRRFNEEQRLAQAGSGSLGAGAYLGNGSGAAGGAAGGGVSVPAGMQQLYNQVFVKPNGGTWSDRDLVSDYNTTLKSAGFGNQRDKQKLELYHSVRPDLFGSAIPGQAFANGGKLKF